MSLSSSSENFLMNSAGLDASTFPALKAELNALFIVLSFKKESLIASKNVISSFLVIDPPPTSFDKSSRLDLSILNSSHTSG